MNDGHTESKRGGVAIILGLLGLSLGALGIPIVLGELRSGNYLNALFFVFSTLLSLYGGLVLLTAKYKVFESGISSHTFFSTRFIPWHKVSNFHLVSTMLGHYSITLEVRGGRYLPLLTRVMDNEHQFNKVVAQYAWKYGRNVIYNDLLLYIYGIPPYEKMSATTVR